MKTAGLIVLRALIVFGIVLLVGWIVERGRPW